MSETPAGWPQGANQAPFWLSNRALLFVDTAAGSTTNTPRVLTVKQAMAFLDLFGNPAQSSNYGTLMGELSAVMNKYVGVLRGGGSAAVATATAQGTLAALQSDPTKYLLADPRARTLVTSDNWYLVFSYLYNYVGHELTGTLGQPHAQHARARTCTRPDGFEPRYEQTTKEDRR